MRHLYNKLSHMNLCEVKSPRVTKNVSDCGNSLGRTEPVCPTCETYWTDYQKQRQLNATNSVFHGLVIQF